MGYKSDQNSFPETHRSESTIEEPRQQPGEPPISNGESPVSPPSYTEVTREHCSNLVPSWSVQDPRSSSTQSLLPLETRGSERRTLLLVYIHGFLGNEKSFQSFPADLHNLLTAKLVETHVVHTKLYPKYKSRKVLEFARDNFSTWLQPHESLETDVILLGHSMGGLLAAEVTLLSPSPTTSAGFKHRLIGTINFDSPFLGMHPGVITSGIGSIFSRAPESQEWPDSSSQAQGLEHMSSYENIPHTTLSQTPTPSKVEESVENLQAASANTRPVPSPVVSQANDPNFNPPFPNDVRIPIRNGWRNALHFINKHSDGLSRATQGYIMSHFEFGGCLADYKGLRKRYSTLRALEDNRKYRRRFVNYYTASTGKPKREKLDPGNDIGATITQISRAGSNQSSIRDQIERERDQSCDQRSLEPSRRTSIEEQNYGDEANLETAPSSFSAERGVPSTDSSAESSFSGSDPGVNRRDSYPIPDHEYNSTKTSEADQRHNHINSSDGKLNSANPVVSTTEDLELPPIPDHPIEPSFFDPTIYKDKDTRKLAGKEHTQQTKFYHRALKDRDTAIKNRRKFLEKRAKAAEKAQGKEKKEAAKAKAVAEKVANDEYEVDRAEKKSAKKEEKRKEKQPSKAPKPNTPNPSSTLSHPPETPKPPKDKKFCLLPSKTAGQRDPTWVRVYMPGVDEVGAHCGLFFPQGEHYEWLVRDVGERVATWIKEGR